MAEQSFMKSLFHGVIAEELIAPFAEINTSDRDEVSRILEGLRNLDRDHVDGAWIDSKAAIPEAVRRGLRSLGLYGARISKDYGGLGLGAGGHARIAQELGAIDTSVAMTLLGHQLGHHALTLMGSDAQKSRYLPLIANGDWTASFALTETLAGSDAAAIHTRAEPTDDGEGYVLSGKKTWVTGGAQADLFTVIARTSPADEGTKPRLTAFIVERAHGVKTGKEQSKLGVRGASTVEVELDGLAVPSANVVGEVGRGFRVAVEVLNHGRLAIGATSIGIARSLVDLSLARATERRAFGRSIGQFGLVKEKVGRMLVDLFALESAVYATAGIVDARVADDSIESAICKVLGVETLLGVVDESMSIAAASGYAAGSRHERTLRDAWALTTFGGTHEILRCFVALSGMQGPGRELTEVARAMREPIKGFGLLSDFAIRRARSALGRERLHRVHPLLNKETVLFEEYVAELARNVDKVLRKHGKEIAEMQFTQRRVADLAIDLYALVACLARTSRAIEKKGEEGARREIELTTAFAQRASERMSANVRAFDRNDDELLKAIAVRGYADGRYPFDISEG